MLLRVTEIYVSLQGEAIDAGYPCVFIRLSECPLRCRWCDTVYSFAKGKEMTIQEILDEVAKFGTRRVELTGGEPLAQIACIPLAKELVSRGYRVLIETSGSEPVADLPKEVHVIMDIKCPGSGMSDKNLYANLDHLKPSDEVKFVISDRADFLWSQDVIANHSLLGRVGILFSPAFGLLKPMDLAEWIIPHSEYRMNLQLHKYIWSPRARGV